MQHDIPIQLQLLDVMCQQFFSTVVFERKYCYMMLLVITKFLVHF